MSVTIAVHNGSKVCRAHNIRAEAVVRTQEHIDPNGIHETWIDEPIRAAYDRIFHQAVLDYNEKQQRDDRKIKDYYTKIKNDSQKHLAYEMIVGVYGTDCSPEKGKDILRQFYDEWSSRNPNLELIGAYYHADEEGDPHLHIDYIPVAHGYKTGMETQTAMRKALEEQGYCKTKTATAQIIWEAEERKYLERLCTDRGLTVIHPESHEHLDVDDYKRVKEAERLKNVETDTVELNKTDVLLNKNRVTVDKTALEKLERQAEAYRYAKSEPSLKNRSQIARDREWELERRERQLGWDQSAKTVMENTNSCLRRQLAEKDEDREKERTEYHSRILQKDSFIGVLLQFILQITKLLQSILKEKHLAADVADSLSNIVKEADRIVAKYNIQQPNTQKQSEKEKIYDER